MTTRAATLEPGLAARVRGAHPLAAAALIGGLAVVAAAAVVEPVTWPLLVLVSFSVVAGATVKNLRQQTAQTRRGEALQNELRATIGELRLSRARVASVADTERRRIERDLHDGCQQRLIALRVKLALAEEIMDGENQLVGELIQEIAADADTALEDLHALVHGIYPSLLTDRGLSEAVKALARTAAVPARVLADGVIRYPADVEAAVYFTCAEALQNCAKHAGPGATARIVLRHESGGLAFEVRDDGSGFDATAARGSGLANMEDRLAAVGGRLRVVSAPSCGAAVQGWVPEREPTR